ncbi:Serine/arginine-rich splicing factor [Zancudomyces culisetae]|uniref:Serine/arginine-rich splicing factor n=1 Tax=Zancudomyces culisetae TaxID=1213189 RepID=A0A1R1PUL7_ZANCU|nr:Serine/arginine-rich splicing factor [Zancudomyces culisetae]|eukprot:OMH84664.1 Serine/arginine-rich splicing factor [Zancudomyces culisetae]
MSSGGSQLFVGRLPRDIRSSELEDLFSRYGKLSRCDIKRGYGFIEYEDRRDAEDALKDADGMRLGGGRIVVEYAKGRARRSTDSNTCFKCGREGHWARDCSSRGTGGRFDRGSRRDRSESRSRSRGRDRDRDRSHRRSRRDHSGERSRKRSRSRSRERRNSRSRSRSRSPEKRERSEERRRDRSPGARSRSYSGSPAARQGRSRSPSRSKSRSRSRSVSRSPSRSRSRDDPVARSADAEDAPPKSPYDQGGPDSEGNPAPEFNQ